MADKITSTDLIEKLRNSAIDEKELYEQRLIIPDPENSKAFSPAFMMNPEKVEDDGVEGGAVISIGNFASRRRRLWRYRSRVSSGEPYVSILSEGDSWFQYPFLLHDVIDVVMDHPEYAVKSLGGASHLVLDMYEDGEVFDEVEALQPEFVLLSGGGNDIVGDGGLTDYLKHYDPALKPEHYLTDAFEARLRELLDTWGRTFRRISKKRPGVQILFHGYDYGIPEEGGAWMGLPMEALGINNQDLRRAIVRVFIDRYNTDLAALANSIGPHIHHIDCRGICADDEWRDELHPNDAGFAKAGAKFVTRIEELRRRARGAVGGAERFCPGRDAAIADGDANLDEATITRITARRARAILGDACPEGSAGETDAKARERDITQYFEKVHIGADFQPASFLRDGGAAAEAVCKVKVPGGSGTGFLIADGRFIMTNNHVIERASTAADSMAEFGYEIGERSVTVALRPEQFFFTDKPLDVTIVACDSAPLAHITPIKLLRNPATVTKGERVNIIQHPRGRRKEIAIRQNKVVNAGKRNVIQYSTDTEPGSSGSPVFNDQWDLVALHHAGWPEAGGGATNEGVRMSSIVAKLIARQWRGQESSADLSDLLNTITDSSPLLGFFDIDGVGDDDGREVEVPDYRGTANFADVGFWNIEHFKGGVDDFRIKAVADVLSRLSMDVMGLTEVQEGSMKRLVAELRRRGDEMGYALLDVSGGQDIAVLYDKDTTTVELANDILAKNATKLRAKTRTGKTAFPRDPLFARCEVKDDDDASIRFMIIVVHLKAYVDDASSRARRALAAKILAEIIHDIRETEDIPVILGGDFNELLTNNTLAPFKDTADLFAMTADDAVSGAATYVGGSFRSVIDHIMISGDVSAADISGDDAAIVRLDRTVRRFTKDVSDHVPVVMRMVLRDAPLDTASASSTPAAPTAGESRVTVPAGTRSLVLNFED